MTAQVVEPSFGRSPLIAAFFARLAPCHARRFKERVEKIVVAHSGRGGPSMLMPMMQIRIMRVGMTQGSMMVPVRMWLRHDTIMGVLVMVVMRMAVFVV